MNLPRRHVGTEKMGEEEKKIHHEGREGHEEEFTTRYA